MFWLEIRVLHFLNTQRCFLVFSCGNIKTTLHVEQESLRQNPRARHSRNCSHTAPESHSFMKCTLQLENGGRSFDGAATREEGSSAERRLVPPLTGGNSRAMTWLSRESTHSVGVSLFVFLIYLYKEMRKFYQLHFNFCETV